MTTFKSTADWLLFNLERFVKENEHHEWVNEESIGWAAIKDVKVMERLRQGGCVHTHKMDEILAFLKDPSTPPRWEKYPLKGIKLKRRTYE